MLPDPGPSPQPSPARPARRRLKLSYLLFFVLLLAGLIPLAVNNFMLLRLNRAALEDQERVNVLTGATALSRDLTDSLRATRRQLALTGAALLGREGVVRTPEEAEERLRRDWVQGVLEQIKTDSSDDLQVLRVLARSGSGPSIPTSLPQPVADALDEAFFGAVERSATDYVFTIDPATRDPLVAIAVPVSPGEAGPLLVVEGVLRLGRIQSELGTAAQDGIGSGLVLIGEDGDVLWSGGISSRMQAELMSSEVVTDFVRHPLTLSRPFTLSRGDERLDYLVRVSTVEETGWGVVVLRPLSAAFEFVDRLVLSALAVSTLLALLALVIAGLLARLISRPIQRLADTSHEIAAGNFGRRVEVGGLTRELSDLARDFNQMSNHVEGYVARLREAARINRDLFIGSLRAFAAAIDAKDPYTRGHSERVASLSRMIARHLSLPEDAQHRIWIGALLHDVGKIGIDDSILKKGGVLTPEEYEQMKSHPVIGAEILSPIEQLREMLPAVRWHHECWNGRGYPDGLRGEAIPVAARVVAVADTFDAITTSRPYQEGYTLEFAIETLTRLAGSRFDAKIVTAFLHAYERGEVREVKPGRIGKVRYDQGAEARVAEVS
jgi:HD-GYP domain-containing protein (c-di-GMP phosphodiesterase class II)